MVETAWDDALGRLGQALQRYAPEEIGVIASPQMSNEDLFALRRLLDHLRIGHRDFRVPPRERGRRGQLPDPRRQEPEHAGRGARGARPGAGRARHRGHPPGARRAKTIKLLWVLHHDLVVSGLREADVTAALSGAETVVFQGSTAAKTSAAAHLVLPSAA